MLILLLTSCRQNDDFLTIGNFDPNHIVEVKITIDENDWYTLRHESRNFMTEFLGDCNSEPFEGNYTSFSADIEMDGEFRSNVEIRKKGFLGSQSIEKPSLKIDVDEYEKGVELFGVDNITLNNSAQDPTLIRQCLSYFLFSQAGIPSPRCNFSHVYVNEEDLGIYVHIEPIKRTFLRGHFDNDDGDLYEGTLSDFHPLKYQTFDPKNSDTDPSLSPILSLTNLLETYPSQSQLQEHIHIQQFLDFWGMETLVGHWDGYTGQNNNNYYIYRDSETQKFSFIPWGADGTLYIDTLEEPWIPKQSVLTNVFLEDETLQGRYHSTLKDLLDNVWDEDMILSEIDRMENLLQSETDLSEQSEVIDDIRDFITQRYTHVQNSLPAETDEDDINNPFCLIESGFLEIEFETTFGSNSEENVAALNNAEIYLTWEDESMTFTQQGVGIGFAPQEDETLLDSIGIVNVGIMPGLHTPFFLSYFQFSEDVFSGNSGNESLLIDEADVFGRLYYSDSTLEFQLIELGTFYGGTISFDEWSTDENTVIRGTISSPYYSFQEITE